MSQRSDDTIASTLDEQDALRHVRPEFPCPYLPGKLARNEAYGVDKLDGALYEQLLCVGFRRSGHMVYRPRCRNCNECRQLRVPIATFQRTKSMNRVWHRNIDVQVSIGEPVPTEDKYQLFVRYLDSQHDCTMARTFESFCEFLYAASTETMELCYWLGDRLIGVSLADLCPQGLSSVYMFFDTDQRRRSLGTFSILWEMEYCRQQGLQYYYLGYYVAKSDTMDYKARFKPNQVLVGSNRWVTLRA